MAELALYFAAGVISMACGMALGQWFKRSQDPYRRKPRGWNSDG